jgi:putative flippase GtrA
MATGSRLSDRLRQRGLKFAAVSVICTVLSQLLIVLFHAALGWEEVPTNVMAVVLTSGPAFALNRTWVWEHTSAVMHREAAVFWSMSMAGLVASTVFVAVASHWSSATWVVSASNLAGFGMLWLVKFWLLDEFLFTADSAVSAR